LQSPATADSVIACQIVGLSAWAKAPESGHVMPSARRIGMQGEKRRIGTGMHY